MEEEVSADAMPGLAAKDKNTLDVYSKLLNNSLHLSNLYFETLQYGEF